MDISHAYAKLLENPREVFVQTIEGDIITWKQWIPLGPSRYGTVYVYPGSFNPLHDGHRSIYDSLGNHIHDTCYETSISRWQKPNVSLEELAKRLAQFVGYAPVIVTNVARMIEKIAVLPCMELAFYVGIDTLVRMRDDYGSIGIGGLNARFIVYDRIVDGDKLQTLLTEFPDVPRNCMRGRERSVELMKVSSTSIRNGNG